MRLSKKLEDKLEKRRKNESLRKLREPQKGVDFSSNDYLGISNSQSVFNATHAYLTERNIFQNGATGSRLISGNHPLYKTTEDFLCTFHQSKSALIFNSGYDANVGFFSSVPQRGDVILYDEYAHASIRDGLSLSKAKSYKFKHNDLKDLESLLERSREVFNASEIYIVTESVFSMDGDSPDLIKMSALIKSRKAYLIVDEARAVGVFGNDGRGMVQELGLEDAIFARIITFGKAMGCHGAAILGSKELKEYLVNFARSFMYTTGLPPHLLATVLQSYKEIKSSNRQIKLQENIQFFSEEVKRLVLEKIFIESNSSIHCCLVSGNKKVKKIAGQLQEKGFEVKPILSPTVPEGEERIRFCLHSYNSREEITNVLETLRIFVV
ncbi:MAG: pyridoxal phosphate-dependent aminotransferase family protein [Flavobacteriaceae bacterium]|nr:pyridoxal phosphate-dependent aminotransferase family protein [Flavobacteriaceae bacterium]